MSESGLLCSLAFNWHDSSVSIAVRDRVVLVLEAERVFRRKKMLCSPDEMKQLVLFGLSALGKGLDDVDYWALGTLGNPFLTEGQRVSRPPEWVDLDLFGETRRALIVNHHLSHAAAFLMSSKVESLVLTCDGGGDFGERVTAYLGKAHFLERLPLPPRPYVTAKIYDLCSAHLYSRERPTADPWLRPPRAEGKMMALAALGVPRDSYRKQLERVCDELCQTTYQKGHDLLVSLFPDLLGAGLIPTAEARDFASTVHGLFCERRLEDIGFLFDHFGKGDLVLSGGSNLNLCLNTRTRELYDSGCFIPPCCDDTGVSLGAICILIAEVYGTRPTVSLPYLGLTDGDPVIDDDEISAAVCTLLGGGILLLHSGAAEVGPRALGNRSFLARGDDVDLKRTLSEKIKSREPYRPLAPVAPLERAGEFFFGPGDSPYMLFEYWGQAGTRESLPCALHFDGTARLQTVTADSNPLLYRILERFGEETGTPVLLNTSLNLGGEPLANTLRDTVRVASRIQHPKAIFYQGRVLE